MNSALMEQVAREVIALSKKYGTDKVKVVLPSPQVEELFRKFNFYQESAFSCDDPKLLDKVKSLAEQHDSIFVVSNQREMNYTVHIPR